jgi:hypothetical protein
MNPILKKFSDFASFKKFEYREVSKPNQSVMEKLKNFKLIYFNWKFKTTYMKDLKYLANTLSQIGKQRLKNYHRIYKLSEIMIGCYIIHSFYWHYKNGFFNTGSKITELYIFGKITMTLCGLSVISFFLFKMICDPIMYEYFSKKEEEWDKSIELTNIRSEEVKEYVKNKEEKANKALK